MCGIAGFSLSSTSTIKVRQLSNALLTSIEDRGFMASGFAWQDKDSMGVYKQAVTGSALPLKTMPKSARNVILHTRLATHGSTEDNRNNHPVMSPTNNIALVHNGVIYNHNTVRKQVTGDLPPVDTSVIPAVIEQHGIEGIDALDGDAAIAWFDNRDSNTLHLARYQHSPLVMCQVEDGSFIFASTEALLWKALIQLNLMPTWMETASELDYYTIRNGIVASKSMLPEPKYKDTYDYGYYRHQTAGAKGGTPALQVGGYASANYYDDEWWDDAFDGPFGYQQALDKDDVYDAEIVDEDGDGYVTQIPVPLNRAKWYTRIFDEYLQEPSVLLYLPSEDNVWKNELYLLANEPTVTLVDYGTIDGTLQYVSLTDSMEF